MEFLQAVFLYGVLAVMMSTEWLGLIDRPSPTVTCEGLKALRVGMSEPQVRSLIGPPVESHGPGSAVQTWDYTPHFWIAGGWKMYLTVESGRLTRATIIQKTFMHQEGHWIYLMDEAHGPQKPEWTARLDSELCTRAARDVYAWRRLDVASAGVLLLAGVLALRRRRRSLMVPRAGIEPARPVRDPGF